MENNNQSKVLIIIKKKLKVQFFLTKHVNFESFFLNAFKPTIIVFLMWLTVIFVSLMNRVIKDNAKKGVDIWWV